MTKTIKFNNKEVLPHLDWSPDQAGLYSDEYDFISLTDITSKIRDLTDYDLRLPDRFDNSLRVTMVDIAIAKLICIGKFSLSIELYSFIRDTTKTHIKEVFLFMSNPEDGYYNLYIMSPEFNIIFKFSIED